MPPRTRSHLVHIQCHRCGWSAYVGEAFFERHLRHLINRSPYATGGSKWPFYCCRRYMVVTPVRDTP